MTVRKASLAGDLRGTLPGQVVLVFQGGGALGAYQLGVYEALHEAGVEPDWVIGTSIGAINAAIIAGNEPSDRLARLQMFWATVQQRSPDPLSALWPAWAAAWRNIGTVSAGIPGFFRPDLVGQHRAAFYSTAPLRETLLDLVDFDRMDRMSSGAVRLTVGAVGVRSGRLRYFDSRETRILPEHVMASGALPPAFPAVRIGDEAYWDGGIYSNTPIEVVFDDRPRRDAVVFAVQLWNAAGDEPDSVRGALDRHKEIQFSSRADSHIARQQQIHRLRHVVSELEKHLPASRKSRADVKELLAYGCRSHMHVVQLVAPRLGGEDHAKDIDFSPRSIEARRAAGYRDAAAFLAAAPWAGEIDPLAGVVLHRR